MDPEPHLPCPQCAQTRTQGSNRVGNRRSACGTCNRFTQTVTRRIGVALREAHPDEAAKLRTLIEAQVYADMGLGAPQ